MDTNHRDLPMGYSDLHMDSHFEFPGKALKLTNQGTKANVHNMPSSGYRHAL